MAPSLGTPGMHHQLVGDPNRTVAHWPRACDGCGVPIDDRDRVCDGEPVRHQVSEIVVRTEIIEQRRMRMRLGAADARWPTCRAGSPRARSVRRAPPQR
jgi:hypothetical protein